MLIMGKIATQMNRCAFRVHSRSWALTVKIYIKKYFSD